MLAEVTNLQMRIQQLEKENRILRKKLERSDAECLQLEETRQKKEFLLRQVINELRESQSTLEKQSCELEQALTNLQRTQIQLVQAEKMSGLGQMVGGVAHEINNPVNFIHANLEHAEQYRLDLLKLITLYQKELPLPPQEIQEFIEEIDFEYLQQDYAKLIKSMKNGTERIRSTVLSLRAFSCLDESEFKQANINEGLDSTLLILQNRLRSHVNYSRIKIIKNYGNLPKIQCCPSQLNQVFMNILMNAIDALAQQSQSESSQIQIQTHFDAEQVFIRIRDNGCGISSEYINRIFDPFFTTKEVGKGTGLGLAISYQIITEQHQGKLKCHSTVGVGTEFVIQLPVNY
jgi:signal transduction histidine kinase